MHLSVFSPRGDEGGGDSLWIRPLTNPNPRERNSRFGHRGEILDAFARAFEEDLYKFLGPGDVGSTFCRWGRELEGHFYKMVNSPGFNPPLLTGV